MPGNAISAFDTARIVEFCQIRTVYLYQETGSVDRKRRSGLARATNKRDDRCLINFVRWNRNYNS